MDWIDFLDINI